MQSTDHHDHTYFWGATNANGLQEAMCSCGHGLQVNPEIHDIVEGKLINLK